MDTVSADTPEQIELPAGPSGVPDVVRRPCPTRRRASPRTRARADRQAGPERTFRSAARRNTRTGRAGRQAGDRHRPAPSRAEERIPARIVLALQGVTKSYPNGRVALRGVDLTIPDGDFVFLVGPSGAGKSTVIKLLIRDEIPTKGSVLLDGRDLARIKRREVPKIRRKIGVVFQDFKLLPNKTVRQNVAFALEVIGTRHREIAPAVDRVAAGGGPRRTRPTSSPTSSPAASSSAPRSPARSCTTRGSSSPTSPPATWTR